MGVFLPPSTCSSVCCYFFSLIIHSFSTSDPLCVTFPHLIVISNNKERKVGEFWHSNDVAGGWFVLMA